MTNKKTFRLQQIRDAFTLSGQKAPAMITLKKWSQDGVFDNCHTLNGAVELAREKYQPKKNSHAGALPIPSDGGSSALEGRLQAIEVLLAKLVGGEPSGFASADVVVAAPSSGANNLLEQVLSATQQLDAVRRHIVVRHDAEVQLLKQTSSTVGVGTTSAASNNDFLEQQKMNVRLSRIEDVVKTILTEIRGEQ